MNSPLVDSLASQLQKRSYEELAEKENSGPSKKLKISSWRSIRNENLDLSYMGYFLTRGEARNVFVRLENEVQYFSGDLARVRVFGKWHDLPRQQAAFGDAGLTYKFSGCTVPALPWVPTILELKNRIENLTGYKYNFCLVNRYRNGNDSMGEHRDDEAELDCKTPIASVSVGEPRDFIFRHRDSRSKNKNSAREIAPVKIELESGSLLLMNWPTNVYWFHSLPVRKKVLGARINLTFRRIISSK